MKKGKKGSRLLPFALCALVVILAAKLAVTIGSSYSTREVVVSTPEVLAGEAKTKTENTMSASPAISESYAAQIPADKPAKASKASKGSSQTAESISALQQREEELRKREALVKEKEEHLAKIEKEVEQKVRDLLAIQKDVQAARSEKQEVQVTKVRSLAKIYGTMKPKEAAKLLDNLDDKLVMGIIQTMTPDEAAAILALMDIKKAAKISEALSGR